MGLFGATNTNPTVYQLGNASVTIDDLSAIFLATTVSISRNLQPIPTINRGVMWSSQPPIGKLTAESILTKENRLVEKLAGGDTGPCSPMELTIDMGASPCNAGSGGGFKLNIHDAFCSTVTFSIDANRGYVGNGIEMSFSNADFIPGSDTYSAGLTQ